MELVENWSGSGPWSLVSWDEGVSYEFEANSNYFKEGRPFFGGIQGFQIVDIGTEIAAYKTERVLMPFDTNMQMGIADHKRLEQDEEFTSRFDLYFLKGTAHQGIQLNGSKPPFDKPEARRALFLALDRWEFIEGLGLGEWPLGTAMSQKNPYALPEDEVKQLPGYRRNPDGSKPQEDIDEAIRLLNSIGYTDDNPMEFVIMGPSTVDLAEIAQIVKDRYQKQGLPIDVSLVSPLIGQAIGAAVSGDFQMMSLGCGVTVPDPDDVFGSCYMPTSRNWSRHTVPGVEALFFKQQAEADPIKRREINHEMQRLVYSSAPGMIEHSNRPRYVFINKRVRTQVGVWHNRLSGYTQLKHEHEWLLPP
jgi:ABC-type transport system substrate-binding protein